MQTKKDYPSVKDTFGSLVFDKRAMKDRLTPDVYGQLIEAKGLSLLLPK